MKRSIIFLALVALPLAAEPRHPLDPLDAQELETMVSVLREAGKLTEGSRFPQVTVVEPPKTLVRRFKPGDPIQRLAKAVILDRKQDKVFEAVVDLNQKKVTTWKHLPGAQPGVLVEEYKSPAEAVRAHPGWQAAIRKRGIEDFEHVQIDTWGTGMLRPEDHKSGRRFLRCLSFYKPAGKRNAYSHPIEGVVALVDPNSLKIVRIEDTGVVAPVVKEPIGELDPISISNEVGSLRPPLKPIVHALPEGTNFQIDGNVVIWNRWRFHFQMHPREGLVLNDLCYQDGGEWRPILYRGSLSEMVVPYGDSASNWHWRNAFDLGEYGVGRLAGGLRKGFEVPSYAVLLDSVFADDFGKPYVEKNNVAIYERELGLLWKHRDYDSNEDQTRPARSLYLTYVATVGNYDYAFSWVLNQDGSISVEAQLTGIVLAKGVKSARSQGLDGQGEERMGRLVGPNIVAPNHQHFFSFRLDFDVDGSSNSVYESNNQAMPPGPENPVKNAFSRRVLELKTEKEARRDINMAAHRTWLVANPNRRNRLGQSTAYQLEPGENSLPYLHPDAPISKRAGFLQHHLWATRYRAEELYSSGEYPNQSTKSSGLPGYADNHESLSNQDVVLWYTMGVTHNPRPEEWPIMSAHRTGFKLLPNGFFGRNPAFDVPPPEEVRP